MPSFGVLAVEFEPVVAEHRSERTQAKATFAVALQGSVEPDVVVQALYGHAPAARSAEYAVALSSGAGQIVDPDAERVVGILLWPVRIEYDSRP